VEVFATHERHYAMQRYFAECSDTTTQMFCDGIEAARVDRKNLP
jgi:hypothetical protein